MSTFKEVSLDLFVARRYLPEQTAAIAVELAQLPNEAWAWRGDPGIYEVGPLTAVCDQLFTEDGVPYDKLPTLGQVACLDIFKSRKRMIINRQAAGSTQSLHQDRGQQMPVDVLHFSDDGNFDYIPIFEPDEKLQELSVGEGDIVRINSTRLKHRGRNSSSHTRYNVVFYSQGIDPLVEIDGY